MANLLVTNLYVCSILVPIRILKFHYQKGLPYVFFHEMFNTIIYYLLVVGVAATMIGEVPPLGIITLLGIHDLRLPVAVITTLHLREGNIQGMIVRH